MAKYKTKITNYGYKEKISVYQNSVKYGVPSGAGQVPRQQYSDMSTIKQILSDERRVSYYKKKVAETIEIALMNLDLDVAVTLTFRDKIISYDYAVEEWQLFLKRLRNLYPDKSLKYICVWEYQKKRSKKLGIEKGGIFHFHALMNLGFIEHDHLEKIWRNGFVWIEKIPGDYRREKAVRYITKYCVKEIITNLQSGNDTRRKRFIFTSNNLKKPTHQVLSEKVSLEDVIFEHMEDVIKDGSYDVFNIFKEQINHVEYVEYKKGGAYHDKH